MVRRIVTVVAVIVACVAAVVLTGASDENVGKVYKAEFDNAFGLTEGGDLRIGGVNAGQTKSFSITETEPVKAIVEFQITEPGFDSLRKDARCQVRQQSLIGEYYVDCQPGTSNQELAEGATIPVEQTSSVIPTDLVNNILREPYRERLRLIIAELGTGLAGRPEDLAATIRRAHPGLRETTETLDILANQTAVLRNFVSDSEAVIDDLAANRRNVAAFVREAGETAEISATRREELAEQFERLPTFLAELDPTMVQLGRLADAQVPLLADLRTAAPDLERFFTELGPFADATRPALRTLGDASLTGRAAISESRNEIRQLRQVANGAGGVGRPLRKFLQTFDSRARAYEPDKRVTNTDPPAFDRESVRNRRNRDLPVQGFTGMEAFWNYFFWQTLSINGFDDLSHYLRSLLILDEGETACSPVSIEPDRGQIERCNSYLGPKQPGIEQATGVIGGQNFGPADPDPTEDSGAGAASSDAQATSAEASAANEDAAQAEPETPTGAKGQALAPFGALPDDADRLLERLREQTGDEPGAELQGEDLGRRARELLQREQDRSLGEEDGAATDLEAQGAATNGDPDVEEGSLATVRQEQRGAGASPQLDANTTQQLLDFLLGP